MALALIGFASSASAADSRLPSASTNYSGSLAQIVLGLFLVLALIAALSWLLKRLPRGAASGGHIRLIESYPLSPRERLLLVAVGNEQLLLAASNAGIQPLHTLQEPLPKTAIATGGAAFATQLASLLPSLQRGRA